MDKLRLGWQVIYLKFIDVKNKEDEKIFAPHFDGIVFFGVAENDSSAGSKENDGGQTDGKI